MHLSNIMNLVKFIDTVIVLIIVNRNHNVHDNNKRIKIHSFFSKKVTMIVTVTQTQTIIITQTQTWYDLIF